ncbi:pseudouridine synthase [Desulfuribacillus stibiiarsenatis]|nr:pseudouridine synthase [Desulfuribacillus stibiiarsenatis]
MGLERIDKILTHLGVGTRKEVKKLCRLGNITVDGEMVRDSSEKVDPENVEIAVDGQVLEYKKYIYVMLHKPAGVVSATEDRQHTTVIDLLPEGFQVFEPFPVGRLDKDTEGLMILTNDGQFSHRVLSPKKQINKMYYVEVNRNIKDADFKRIEEGIALEDGYVTMPAVVSTIESLAPDKKANIPETFHSAYANQRFMLTIQEGKYHQVKRMVEAAGSEVVYLKRISVGNLVLDSQLAPGDCRELTEDEMEGIL